MALSASSRVLLSVACRRAGVETAATINSVKTGAAATATAPFSSRRSASSSAAVEQEQEDTRPSTPSPSSLALAAFRAHNSSLPGIAGSTTLAKVLRVERDFVTVDGGCLKRPVRLAKGELREGQLVSSSLPKLATTAATAKDSPLLPLLRSGPSDVRVGDVLRFHVEHLTGPYGEASLSAEPKPRPAAARAAAWNAVLAAAGAERTRAAAAAKGERETSSSSSAFPSSSSSSSSPSPPPLSTGKIVYGRVLNALPTGGGYAVGVAGVVGFLPFSAAAPSTGARIGVLQRFRVTSAVPSTGSFVLEDEGAAARREAQARRQAAWLAARREEAEAAGEEWVPPSATAARNATRREPREPRQRGGSSSTSASSSQHQQRGQRGSRHPQQQHRGGAASEREEGWYKPLSRR